MVSEKRTLTAEQKLCAMAMKYYHHYQWEPKPGDYYTSARADLELYRVVKIKDGIVYTKYCDKECDLATWLEDEFLTEGFGLDRVYVPRNILFS